MTEKSVSFTEWFSLWPSVAMLAEDMNVPKKRADQWVRRGSLQAYYWRDFITAISRRHGRQVTLDDLVDAILMQRDLRIKAMIRAAKIRAVRREASIRTAEIRGTHREESVPDTDDAEAA